MKTILKDEAPRDFHIEISQVPESHLIPQASITMSSPLSLHIRVPSPMSAETTDSESDFADDQNSVQVQSFTGLNCSISPNNPFQSYDEHGNPTLRYSEVINYGRCAKSHHCVMCGAAGNIPAQNKDVCKVCDSVFWFNVKLDVVIKFCKGCKNFVPLNEFQEKPDASKCGKCRHRGRQNYFARKYTCGSSPVHREEATSPFTSVKADLDNAPCSASRPPIVPRRSYSDEMLPITSVAFKLSLFRSVSDSSMPIAHGTPSKGICLEGTTPRTGSVYPSSALKGSVTRAIQSNYKPSPRTVSFSLTPQSIETFHGSEDAESASVSAKEGEYQCTHMKEPWEWDPTTNPLMCLAMLTEHISPSSPSEYDDSNSNWSGPKTMSTPSPVGSAATSSSSFLSPSECSQSPAYSEISSDGELLVHNIRSKGVKVKTFHLFEPSQVSALENGDDTSLPNFKLPPRKRAFVSNEII